MFESSTQPKLAVLIDADNIMPNFSETLFTEIAKLGDATVRRIYGDWTTPNLRGWKTILPDYAIQPMQQFQNTTGKNATDMAFVIDAMDLLYTKHIDGFCLVSSDSDFTKLASRIREEGKIVYGFGERKTPKAMVSICTKFVYLENFANPIENMEVSDPNDDRELVDAIRSLIEQYCDDSGWMNSGRVGGFIRHRFPDFDPRNYGCKKMADVWRKFDDFQLENRTSDTGNPALMIRLK